LNINSNTLTLLPDFREEGWLSMDLFEDMILAAKPQGWNFNISRPAYRRRFARLHAKLKNVDRLYNRFHVYPNAVRSVSADKVLILDHSYAHLASSVPRSAIVGVICHDINAFRSVVQPDKDPRPRWFRAMTQRILSGMKRADVVFADSIVTRDDLLEYKIVDPAKIYVLPAAPAPEFTLVSVQAGSNLHWLDTLNGTPWILHVGSCVNRKRIDVLLNVFASLRKELPELKLVKISGEWSTEHKRFIDEHKLVPGIIHHTGLNRIELAEVYRRARVVLMTSEQEGFGLPVLEALACGTPVVATDLPVFREVGGAGALYAPLANIPAWVNAVKSVLSGNGPDRQTRLNVASGFTWHEYTRKVLEILSSKR
jgi:glycosyltransferase involved in cell wall biosynthesis